MTTIVVKYGLVSDLGKEGITYLKEGTTEVGTFTHPLEGVTIVAGSKITKAIERGIVYYTVITPA